MPATVQAVPFHVKGATRNRPTAAASGATASNRRRASGPCTAMMARSAVTSSPPIAARTRSVLEALGITSKTSSSRHHTMMSSSTEASSGSSRCVYCARPGAILPRSLVSWACSVSSAPAPSTRTVPRWLTSNATAPLAAGQVLLDRAARVGQRHLPTAEGHQAGAERSVLSVER